MLTKQQRYYEYDSLAISLLECLLANAFIFGLKLPNCRNCQICVSLAISLLECLLANVTVKPNMCFVSNLSVRMPSRQQRNYEYDSLLWIRLIMEIFNLGTRNNFPALSTLSSISFTIFSKPKIVAPLRIFFDFLRFWKNCKRYYWK